MSARHYLFAALLLFCGLAVYAQDSLETAVVTQLTPQQIFRKAKYSFPRFSFKAKCEDGVIYSQWYDEKDDFTYGRAEKPVLRLVELCNRDGVFVFTTDGETVFRPASLNNSCGYLIDINTEAIPADAEFSAEPAYYNDRYCWKLTIMPEDKTMYTSFVLYIDMENYFIYHLACYNQDQPMRPFRGFSFSAVDFSPEFRTDFFTCPENMTLVNVATTADIHLTNRKNLYNINLFKRGLSVVMPMVLLTVLWFALRRKR